LSEQNGPALTPLNRWHREHGARMVAFAGFDMPVQYRGVLAEHAAVRRGVGLFDISHMGEIYVAGPDAETWLDGLVTNRVAGLAAGKVVYTALCNETGGVLDDMLVYRLAARRWLVVCNAANRAKVAAWFAARRGTAQVTIDDRSDEVGLVAVQGPRSRELVGSLAALDGRRDELHALRFYSAMSCPFDGAEWLVSRTGYTGEHGYEIYAPNAQLLPLWEELIWRGADLEAEPIGLAARDTLRFEVCYSLYGHELSEETTPLEAGIGWAVKLKKERFVGLEALRAQKAAGVPRRLIGLEVAGRTIARQGAVVYGGGEVIGVVTSGSFSPTLERSLALALVTKKADTTDLEVEVRGRRFGCRAVATQFLPARVKGDPQAERTLP
jgi:aminomethyltransferase